MLHATIPCAVDLLNIDGYFIYLDSQDLYIVNKLYSVCSKIK